MQHPTGRHFHNRDFNEALRRVPHSGNDYGWHVSHIAWQNALGRSYVGCGVWDAMRVLDYVVQRPDVDSARLGCIGFSLSGLLTLYLAVLDARIMAALAPKPVLCVLEGTGPTPLFEKVQRVYDAWAQRNTVSYFVLKLGTTCSAANEPIRGWTSGSARMHKPNISV